MYKDLGVYQVTSKQFDECGNYIHCYKTDTDSGSLYVHYYTLAGDSDDHSNHFGDKSPFAKCLELISNDVESFAEDHPELLI